MFNDDYNKLGEMTDRLEAANAKWAKNWGHWLTALWGRFAAPLQQPVAL